MRCGEAGSVLSKLAEHMVAVDAHSGFWHWNVAVRAAPVSRQLTSSIEPVGHKEHCHTGQDRGCKQNGRDTHASKCNRRPACQAPTELAKGNQLPFRVLVSPRPREIRQ
jgi:hypothetical protein